MMMMVMAMGQRNHSKQMLGDRAASVNRFFLIPSWSRASHRQAMTHNNCC